MSITDKLGSLSSKDDLTPPNRVSLGGSIIVEPRPPAPDMLDSQGLVQRSVIIQRDEKGYGLTVSGDNPVFVQSVKENGAAARAGVQQGDRIVKVNGTLVTNSNHIEVVKLIKSGSYVALTVLGRPGGGQSKSPPVNANIPVSGGDQSPQKSPSAIPVITSITHNDRVSAPKSVDAEKSRALIQQKLDTIRAMHEQAVYEYDDLRTTASRQPSDRLKSILEEKLKTVKTLEKQLYHNNYPPQSFSSPQSSSFSSSRDSGTGDSLEPIPEPGDFQQPWMPRHAKTGSVPVSLYESPDSLSRIGLPRSHSDAAQTRSKISSDSYPPLVTGGLKPLRSESEKSESASVPLTGQSVDALGGMSDSPGTSPNTSPTPTHPLNYRTYSESINNNSMDTTQDIIGVPSQPVSQLHMTPTQVDVISIEDDEFSSDEENTEDHGPFGDLALLEKKSAYMAIFLHYLISNSDPSALFFNLLSDAYMNAAGGIKELRKWAYEIHSTFLVINAPLKVVVDDSVITTIDNTLQYKQDKEDTMRSIFVQAREVAQSECQELLADFRNKKALGLGNIYGVHELHENLNKSAEITIIDKYLSPHFVRIMEGEDMSERNQALAAALSTFLKHVGVKSHASLMERTPSFITKDKRIKLPGLNTKKNMNVKGHQFVAQHFMQSTVCQHCQSIIGGVGYQGYQCGSCEMTVHKICVTILQEMCGKKKSKRYSMLGDRLRKPVISTVTVIPSAAVTVNKEDRENGNTELSQQEKRNSQFYDIKALSDEKDPDLSKFKEQGHSVGSLVQRFEDTTTTVKPEEPVVVETPKESKHRLSTNLGRSESMKGRTDMQKMSKNDRRARSDIDMDDTSLRMSLNTSGSSSTSSLSTSNSTEALNSVIPKPLVDDDSDFDVEPELPPLKHVFKEETFRKLKPKEKKRQEVINELFYTERTHVRNLKVLQRLFQQPMLADPNVPQQFVQLLFPNLEDLVSLHCSLNNDMKDRKKNVPCQGVVTEVGDILLKRVDGEPGNQFRDCCAIFCQNQSYMLEMLKTKQRRDEKFNKFLNEAESSVLCRRLQLKDLLPMCFQRLTKYPLLIESLLKYTPINTDEYRNLEKAVKQSKQILDYVNQAVKECENHQRLVDLNKRLDRRPIESSNNPMVADFKNIDLTKHKLVHEGPLTWRLSRNKQIDLQVVLLEDILVLLQKQDERLILKCQSTMVVAGKDDTKYTHSPVIRLTNLLTRQVATDKKAFFLVSTSALGPQIYELVAISRNDSQTWLKLITEAASTHRSQDIGGATGQVPGLGGPTITPETDLNLGGPEQITMMRPQISITQKRLRKAGTSSGSDSSEPPPTPSPFSQFMSPDANDVDSGDLPISPPSSSVPGNNATDSDQVGISHIPEVESVQLIQPEDVTITNTLISEAEQILTPFEKLRRNNETIRRSLIEKEDLMAEILGYSSDHRSHATELTDLDLEQDARELVVASIHESGQLISLINESAEAQSNASLSSFSVSSSQDIAPSLSSVSLDSSTEPAMSVFSVTSEESVTAAESTSSLERDDVSQSSLLQTAENAVRVGEQAAAQQMTVPIPMDKIRVIAERMNSILTNLLTVVNNKEEERERIRHELHAAQEQLSFLRDLQLQQSSHSSQSTSSSFSKSERPTSMISIASSEGISEDPCCDDGGNCYGKSMTGDEDDDDDGTMVESGLSNSEIFAQDMMTTMIGTQLLNTESTTSGESGAECKTESETEKESTEDEAEVRTPGGDERKYVDSLASPSHITLDVNSEEGAGGINPDRTYAAMQRMDSESSELFSDATANMPSDERTLNNAMAENISQDSIDCVDAGDRIPDPNGNLDTVECNNAEQTSSSNCVVSDSVLSNENTHHSNSDTESVVQHDFTGDHTGSSTMCDSQEQSPLDSSDVNTNPASSQQQHQSNQASFHDDADDKAPKNKDSCVSSVT